MTGARQVSWPPNIVLTIVLALLAAQQAYFNFNSTTKADIAVLQSQVAALRNDLNDARRELGERREQR